MLSRWAKKATCCLGVSPRDGSHDDPLFWSKDLERHAHGDFSFAVVQANAVLEDHSQVEAGGDATFIGVYDGHGGDATSTYVSEHLFGHLNRLASENRAMSEAIIRNAFAETENGFLELVRRERANSPLIAATGSCCLVGVIWNRTLFVANLGDARAVLGYTNFLNNIAAEQLTQEHNASVDEIRRELTDSHPEDPEIVFVKNGAWRVKGIIQITRAIGDAYLKSPEFAMGPEFPKFHLPEPLSRAVLRADPTMVTRNLRSNDKFIIFASDGLWDYVTNEDAVKIVANNPRPGIARKLLMSAMKEAALRCKMPYHEIKQLEPGTRRQCHDDITIVVVFLNHEMLNRGASSSAPVPQISVRGFVDAVGPTNFNIS